MLRKIAIALAAGGLLGAASIPTDALAFGRGGGGGGHGGFGGGGFGHGGFGGGGFSRGFWGSSGALTRADTRCYKAAGPAAGPAGKELPVASDRLPSARIAASAKTDLRVMFLFLLVP
jgi:hypothetical protein